jgi:toxin CcdB
MAQFDVHRNTGKHRDRIPYVVVVQSALFDDYGRRVVVPLVKTSSVGKIANPRFNPRFKIGKTSVVLHPLEIVSVSLTQLAEPVASLATEGERIIQEAGGTLVGVWVTLGRYDVVEIFEAPDDETAAEIVMKLQVHGAEHTETLRGFTREEAEEIVRKL